MPTMSTSYTTGSGNPLNLGRQLGRGAEGVVYELPNDASLAAKVYHKPIDRDRAEKIKAMAALRNTSLERFTAWPRDLLLSHGSQPVGLTMARVPASKDVHNLYGPKSRLAEFPRADWRFLVRASTNIARAFAAVHDVGVVIGDVNHGSVLVADDATVRLIDCDSFQFTTGGRRFPCTMGVETFTPPELQGIPFAGVAQTPSHDGFRLAVLVFHLLFLGRHPFAGRYLGQGEMPLGKAIKESRFAYSNTNKAMQMDRPPGTPSLDIVGNQMAGLFEIAFSHSAISSGRPSDRDWIEALERLDSSLRRCSNNHGHWFASHVKNCPWCEIEAMGSNALFPLVLPPGSSVDVESLWKQVAALPALGPPTSPFFVDPSPSPAALKFKKPLRLPKFLSALAGWAAFIGLTIAVPAGLLLWIGAGFVVAALIEKIPKGGDDVMPFRVRETQAGDALRRAETDWKLRTSEQPFEASRRKLQDVHQRWAYLPGARLRKLEELRQNQKNLQLSHFLDRFKIESAKIKGIGPAKKDVLISYGIETADDIVETKVLAIPGFGPVTVSALIAWRDTHARKFTFDASKAVDPRDVAQVEHAIVTERSKLQSEAKTIHAEAMQRYAAVKSARSAMPSQIEALLSASRQAVVDLKYVES